LHRVKERIAHQKIVEKELEEYEKADYIQLISSFAKRTFIECGVSPDKIILATPGVDILQFSPVKKEDHIFRIIYCGGISIRKGVHYLLRAFYELNLPNSELWLIGNFSEGMRPFLKRYYSPKIRLKGVFPQSKLYEQYSQGSLACLNSIEDGFGVVILQAMACGLPVICTTNTGGSDVIQNGIDGFIIPIRDIGALKEKILFLYENKDRCREMGELARKRSATFFTWDDYGNKIISIYNKIIKN
jgi:glycosyltransferase involved in cell wall biosynthesis